MTREKAKQILGDGASEEQVTEFLNTFHSELREKEKEISNLNSKLNSQSDYDELKKKLDDIEKANMTEQEKIANMQKEAENNLKQSKMIVNKAKATEILAGLNISEDIINSLVRDDEEATLTNANNLKSQIENMREETIRKTKEELATIDVKPNISNVRQNDNEMTWEKFTKLSQEEQNKFAKENPEEFEKL